MRSVSTIESNKTSNSKAEDRLFFIDKFVIPANVKERFIKQTNYNRNFIKNLPGFIKDNAYESTDANGNVLFTTIAVWENQDAMNNAKEKVQAEYKRIGFDPAEFLKSLGIIMDRAIYKEIPE